jgi:hypothetical protein
MPFEMDAYTTKMVTAIGLLLLVGLLWVVWKFFYALFKHVLIALFIAAIGSGIYYYVMYQAPPAKDLNVGKHAYGASSGRYLGEIEASQNDPQSGPVWIIRQPGGQQTKIAKARVVVKDKMDPVAVEEPSPSPSPSVKPKTGTAGRRNTR